MNLDELLATPASPIAVRPARRLTQSELETYIDKASAETLRAWPVTLRRPTLASQAAAKHRLAECASLFALIRPSQWEPAHERQ